MYAKYGASPMLGSGEVMRNALTHLLRPKDQRVCGSAQLQQLSVSRLKATKFVGASWNKN